MPCLGCDCEADEGETYCDMCREELVILVEDFIKYELPT